MPQLPVIRPVPSQSSAQPQPPRQLIGYPELDPSQAEGTVLTIENLKGIARMLGIEPGSSGYKGAKSVLGAPANAIQGAKQAGADAWRSFAKAPQPDFPDNPETMTSLSKAPYQQAAAPLSTALGPNQFQVPSGFDPSKTVSGTASYGGPKLNTEPALAGLKAANAGAVPPRSTAFGQGFGGSAYDTGIATSPSRTDLYKMSFRDPTTGAPGANEYWGSELKEQIGDEDFQTALAQHAQEAVQAGQTQQHPAIQSTLQQAAERGPLGVAKIAAGSAQNRLDALQSMLSSPNISGRSVSIAGVGGIGATPASQQIPPALQQQLTTALANIPKFGLKTFTINGYQPSSAKIAVDAAIQNILARMPDVDGANLQGFVDHIMKTPELSKLPTAQILEAEPDLSASERMILNAMLVSNRGY